VAKRKRSGRKGPPSETNVPATPKTDPASSPERGSSDETATPAVSYTREELRHDLMRGLITEPLLGKLKAAPSDAYDIIISLNEQYPEGIDAARKLVEEAINGLTPRPKLRRGTQNYVFATMIGSQILELASVYRDWIRATGRWSNPVYRVWEDSEIRACVNKSISTIKADACHRAFCSKGEGIVWAVLDSGINGDHPHFAKATIDKDLSKTFVDGDGSPLVDNFGHGTHVAGIIAGSWESKDKPRVMAVEALVEGTSQTEIQLEPLGTISGIAPEAKLVSYKVLDDSGVGKTSAALAAIEEIQNVNQYGRRLRIHGVNISLGYDFNPRWFACGQSPLCVEVDRLVRSGVVVVVAAGNSGFSALGLSASSTNELGYRAVSINDPGNSELAITVGATHRDMPHMYGVSFFSSRGPTGDGRAKPDLVAPGERIVSCAAGSFKAKIVNNDTLPAGADVLYLEQSGTSMAAPHVSGAIAAFLSVRREFIGQPEKVKEVFLENTIDLRRERSFQGSGLLDLLKVMQAV